MMPRTPALILAAGLAATACLGTTEPVNTPLRRAVIYGVVSSATGTESNVQVRIQPLQITNPDLASAVDTTDANGEYRLFFLEEFLSTRWIVYFEPLATTGLAPSQVELTPQWFEGTIQDSTEVDIQLVR